MCDASSYVVGAVLSQRKDKVLHPIYYASKTLNDVQENYTTTDKEMLAVAKMLRKRGRLSWQVEERNVDPTSGGPEVRYEPYPKGKETTSKNESSTPRRLASSVGSIQTDPEKKHDVERLKALWATTFDGATDPVDAELVETVIRVEWSVARVEILQTGAK
ncbi:uncharacterized protein LOC120089072 [Benincasa hispida]|uniref:uncharacterized protein LOC120089072 n=1 Tax=Benincasa hispida TaxID=102211 RepID=UPI00190030F4|nr:uncharacterized protein LOC120089072 [Benincasa hispida]